MIEVVAVLDRSGSMSGDEGKVIDAYNEFINKQRNAPYECRVTLVLFDDQYEEVYHSLPVYQVPALTKETYFTRGMTALNDAIGKTINRFGDSKNVFFFVETDGHENHSKEFSSKQIKEMIRMKERKGWEFTFIGADLSVEETQSMSSKLGFDPFKTQVIPKTDWGYATRNSFVCDSISTYAAKVGEDT